MLTTSATLVFLFVTSGLAALAVHEYLGSGRKRRGVSDADSLRRVRAEIEGGQRIELDEIQALIGGLKMEQQTLASELERRSQAFTREGAQHEAALAVVFQEMRNGNSELRHDLDHLNRIMAEMGTQIVSASRASVSREEAQALIERVDSLERSLQSQDLRLCALDDSMSGVVKALAPDDTDLKRIKGIGAALEQTLKGLGVETIDQVANLSIDQIETLSEKLGSFASRIERDGWVEQAKALQAASAIG
ncbi:NADH dehydrogenase subunit E [Planctomycetes bacterium Poly30]|uniref:NADH dehydrogenase subunit E n=1 Tax=Saltatorellus ferox TaxID=2528018 RepID=A0A518ENV7_9BACT|nr:NADH dehydrogenase subunit E [Planctomycetes bacterium Poly30]